MAQSRVTGDGPVRLTSQSGKLILVPLTELYFDDQSVLQADVGLAYQARYDAVGATAGPSVSFSLTDSGFEVHSVGEWVH